MAVWPHSSEDDDGLDELGNWDDQVRTGAHPVGHRNAPAIADHRGAAPRAPTDSQSDSVVIAPHAEVPAPRKKSRTEPTLVIRDRRRIVEMRSQVLKQVRDEERRRKVRLIAWSAAGVLAFAIGGIGAAAWSSSPSSQAAAQPSDSMRGDSMPVFDARIEAVGADEAAPVDVDDVEAVSATASPSKAPGARVLSLDDLPEASTADGDAEEVESLSLDDLPVESASSR